MQTDKNKYKIKRRKDKKTIMKYLRRINVIIKERHFLQKEIASSLEDVERLKEKNKTLKCKVKKLNLLLISIKINNFFRKKKRFLINKKNLLKKWNNG